MSLTYQPIRAQGTLNLANVGGGVAALTRIGSTKGPKADGGIFAEFLVGTTPQDLFPLAGPVGSPIEHRSGVAIGGVATLLGLPPGGRVWVKMVAWDGRIWGTNLTRVPSHQLGMTDTVMARLDASGPPPGPLTTPQFRKPAVVPAPLTMKVPQTTNNDQLQLEFDIAVFGREVVIESSTNLLQWAPISTNTVWYSPYQFSDPPSPDGARKYYRAWFTP